MNVDTIRRLVMFIDGARKAAVALGGTLTVWSVTATADGVLDTTDWVLLIGPVLTALGVYKATNGPGNGG